MIVQFICRGNAFRSIIAEAYLNSLRIPGMSVVSSGTVASKYKDLNRVNFPKTLTLLKKHGIEQFAKSHYADDLEQNLLDKTDVAIFLNARAHDEAKEFLLPKSTFIWDVSDLGEKGRIATNEAQREQYSQDVYEEIVKNINEMVTSGMLRSS